MHLCAETVFSFCGHDIAGNRRKEKTTVMSATCRHSMIYGLKADGFQ